MSMFRVGVVVVVLNIIFQLYVQQFRESVGKDSYVKLVLPDNKTFVELTRDTNGIPHITAQNVSGC